MTTESITIEIDGITITGLLIRNSKFDITVEMTSPYPGIRKGRHLMVLARPSVPNGYDGEAGIERGKELLVELYDEAKDREIQIPRIDR